MLTEAFVWVCFSSLHVMELYLNGNPGVPVGLQDIWGLFQKIHIRIHNVLSLCHSRVLFLQVVRWTLLCKPILGGVGEEK